MEEESQLPFSEVLLLLLKGESVPIQHLCRLSELDEQQIVEFRQRWSETADDRRLEISRHLADLSELNFVVNYSPIFTYMLADRYAPIRIAALEGLWDCDDEELVDSLISLMKDDPVVDVKVAAARSLTHFLLMSEWGQLPGTKVAAIFNALCEVYEDPETELPVKGAALEAMGPYSNPKVAEFIEESFEGSVPELQRSALFAMGISADPRWLQILLDELESPYAEMRAEAARAAGGIGADESVSLLSELLFDEDDDVARAAIMALSQIGGEQANRALEVLLSDESLSHLHEAAEEAMEESEWLEGDLPLYPWSDSDFDLSSEIDDIE